MMGKALLALGFSGLLGSLPEAGEGVSWPGASLEEEEQLCWGKCHPPVPPTDRKGTAARNRLWVLAGSLGSSTQSAEPP